MKNKGKKNKNSGPKPDSLKIDEENWEIAVKKAILRKKPESGWPDKDKAKDS
ncbi:MAG: hypothetical protein JW787_18125 [Sedimentisphaerales bacterium]|nr:hypothetical protein [Sedimentisphaerales bacterium]